MDRERYRYRAVLAGTGAGKTLSGLFEDIRWGLDYPGVQIGVWAPSYPMVRGVLYPTLRKLIGNPNRSPLVVDWNRSDHRLELVTGSTLWFGSMEDPTRSEGKNLDLGHLDEARIVKNLGGEDGALEVIDRRLRGSTAGHESGMIVTTSAPTKALYDWFENPATRKPGSMVYRWSSLDNPYLPAKYKAMIGAYTGATKKRMVLGEYARAEGLVYETYDPTRHVTAGPTAGVVTSVTVGVDWGWTHPSAFMVIEWYGNSVAHVRSEVFGDHYPIAELVRHATLIDARYGPPTGPGVKFWCGADRPDHVQAFRDAGLDAEAYMGRVLDGIGVVQDMFAGGELTIGRGCVNLLRELDAYSWKQGSKEAPEDVDEDACSALRYGVCGGPPESAEVYRGKHHPSRERTRRG